MTQTSMMVGIEATNTCCANSPPGCVRVGQVPAAGHSAFRQSADKRKTAALPYENPASLGVEASGSYFAHV